MFWPWERAAEVMHAWREWTLTVPDEVTSLGPDPAAAADPGRAGDAPRPRAGDGDAAILGSRAFGAEMVQALRDLEPEIDTFDMVPPVALSRLHNDPENPVPVLTEHRLLSELPAEAIDAFLATAGPDSGSPLLIAELRHLGGALAVSKPGHGAQPTLEAGYLAFAAGIPASPELIAGLQVALPGFKSSMASWDAGRGYLNFEENTVDSRSFYDEVTHRHLAHIKAQVDPADVFRSNHPIAPAK